MSGTGKRLHENFGNLPGKVSSSARQHDELSAAMASGDQRSQGLADMAALPDNVAESRPAKLPRLELGSKNHEAQRPSGLEDPAVEMPFFGLSDSRACTDEKGFSGGMKKDTIEEKSAKDARIDHSHMDYRPFFPERVDYRSGWKREQRSEHKEEFWDFRKDLAVSLDPRNLVQHAVDHVDSSWSSKKIARNNSLEEDGELRDPEEAVGENKVDVKRQEKDKERERKTKDDAHREKEDREKEDIPEWRSQINELFWEREREKKERGREKERDKRDQLRRTEKDDASVSKKDLDEFDAVKKTNIEGGMTLEHSELERKPPKELEGWKGVERDENRMKERENDKKADTDRIDKKSKDQEKEPEETSPEEVIGEREKETFVNYSFQQKRRMLRARGHSQVVGKDGRPRFHSKDMEGNQGNTETTAILYRPGEYMPELAKAWKEYETSLSGKIEDSTSSGQGPTLEIRIPTKLVTTSNHQVRGSQLWGTDVYTDDSDLVAVLMHTGYYRPTASPPPLSILELRATIRVLPPQDSYTSTLRNNVRSRAWGAASGCSYSVEQCHIVKVGGGHIDLEPCLTRIWAVAPTLAPATMERTMTTRAASANAYRQQRLIQEVTIQYNLCNEPWMKYSMSIVADRGLKKSQFTSAKLSRGEVLYVETHRNRYELCYDGEKVTSNGVFGATTATSAPLSMGEKNREKENEKLCAQNGEKAQGRSGHNNDKGHAQIQNGDATEHFKWSRCKQPLPLKVMLGKGVPLPSDCIEVLEDRLAWDEIQWSQAGVWVRGKEYPLARAQFLFPNQEDGD